MKNKLIGAYEKNTIVLFVMMMTANFGSYLFQIITGKILSVEDYGMLNTIVSLVSILTSASSVLLSVTVKSLAELEATNPKKISEAVNCLINITLILQVIFFVICLPLTKVISLVLAINENKYVIIAIIISVIVLMSYSNSGIMQGLQQYKNYGMQEVLLSISKLVLAIIFYYLGFGFLGILLAYGLSYVVKFLYFEFTAKKAKLYKFSLLSIKEDIAYIRTWNKYIMDVLVVRIAMLLLLNIDVLLIKSLFSEKETGVYSSGMVIAKIGTYIATTLIVPLFPMATKDKMEGKNTINIFKKAFIYGSGSSIAFGFFLVLFGNYVISILFGSRYINVVHLFKYMCAYVFCITSLIIIMNYVMAIDRLKCFSVTLIAGIICSFFLVQRYHNSINQVLIMMIIVFGIVTLINVVDIFRGSKKFETKK